jgi:hypothetical protein
LTGTICTSGPESSSKTDSRRGVRPIGGRKDTLLVRATLLASAASTAVRRLLLRPQRSRGIDPERPLRGNERGDEGGGAEAGGEQREKPRVEGDRPAERR